MSVSTRLDQTAASVEFYSRVRAFSEFLSAPLETEDYVIQTMPDVSPTKWHLAHTTWFFETFLLKPFKAGYQPYNPLFEYLFNSYYNSVGAQFCRPRRGTLSRPTVKEVFDYRHHVDQAMERLMAAPPSQDLREIEERLTLGIHHEQQHQELMLTDIKNVFAANPLRPIYRERLKEVSAEECPLTFQNFDGGIIEVGHSDDTRFAFDNETPRHEALLRPFQLANRLITNREFIEFICDGGYTTPTLWLSPGWAMVKSEGWEMPFYWEKIDDKFYYYTLGGFREVHPEEPVTHISYYEADAFARWAGARLPSEEEWEVVANRYPIDGNFVESQLYHPTAASNIDGIQQLYGDVWEWTKSPYISYPGYQPAEGALGEYNAKFMCNQLVLRGGSCASAQTHIRPTYRNFFPPDARWQFSGIRLAKDENR